MRGCDNLCAYCVVPFTRGAERSRDPQTIIREVKEIIQAGYREVAFASAKMLIHINGLMRKD